MNEPALATTLFERHGRPLRAGRTLHKGALGNESGGEKQATIDSGETIELELPAITDHGVGFEVQRTSIRVTVRRVS